MDREQIAESLGLETQPVEPAFGRARATGLPRSYLIGSPPDLLRRVVMVVHTDDARPGLDEPPEEHYWRLLTYDQYNGRGWATSDTAAVEYPPGQTVVSPTLHH